MDVQTNQIISISEVSTVVADLKSKRRYKNNRMNLIIFRLSACCGLRVSEIADLLISDVDVTSARPHVVVQNGKGNKRRVVPLHWDGSTLADVAAYLAERVTAGAGPMDHLLITSSGKRVDRSNLRKRFVNVTKILNRPLTIHSGRHSFCSNALAAGKTLAEVRDAAGHSSVATTNTYLHVTIDDGTVTDIFAAS